MATRKNLVTIRGTEQLNLINLKEEICISGAVRLEILRPFIFGLPHPAHRALTPKKNEHYYLPWNPRTTDN
ncbi:hypothetical protein NIES4074_29190 [Cylindrospermum sp. NIES-4074]|nr:hypothetical protein NIES4074_29190 [Cylindrospermum sp. NIES-4074]